MSPGLDSSSWHPAFRPNSEQDQTSTHIVESDAVQTTKPAPFEVESKSSESPSAPAHDTVATESDETALVEDSGNAELSSLRNALATSLANPGGVELNENPLHNVPADPQLKDVKGGFPSGSPLRENGHSSTMSFARTVSDGLDFGEDDEVDSEWNIQRETSDPFKSMAQMDRSNSFPSVPLAHVPGASDVPIHHSQAEDIMQEVEDETKNDLFTDDADVGDDFFGQQAQPVDDPEEFLPESQTESANPGHTSVEYGQSYGSESLQDADQEFQARFEEGIPLVQPSETRMALPQTIGNDFFDGDNHEDDFFAQVSPSEDTIPEQPRLERKSTTEIMGSMGFNSHEQGANSIEEEASEYQTPLERTTGGGIAVSRSTVLSQVLGEPDTTLHGDSDSPSSLTFESGDGDLAEKWKAALAEDEFLDDDDELLPDDDGDIGVTNENSLDPADLFGSDDEGFLEDTDDVEPSTELSSLSSPAIPSAIKSPNGTMVGFDALGGAVQNRPSSSSSRYLPAGASTMPIQPVNNYAPTAPLLADFSQQASFTPSQSPYAAPQIQNFQPPPQPRPELPKAQSFANQAKGGYSSPYDLPMDVVKPRKRVSNQNTSKANGFQAQQAPPPRTSSMYSNQSNISSASLSPPTSSHSQQAQIQSQPLATTQKTVRKSQSGFFEELPMSIKARQAPRHASSFVSPSPSIHTPPNSAPHQPTAGGLPHFQHPNPPSVQSLGSIPGLIAPERVSPYASLPAGNMTVPPPAASRYSPAPPTSNQSAPPPLVAQSRYSPAPPNQRALSFGTIQPVVAPPTIPQPPFAHQPRTSSPLAHFERTQDHTQISSNEHASFDRRKSSSYESNLRNSHLPPTREVDENEQTSSVQPQHEQQAQLHRRPQLSQTPPPPQGLAIRNAMSPPKRTTSNYLPHSNTQQPPSFAPPQRSQTQSPGTAFAGPRLGMSSLDPYQRPASVELPSSPRQASSHQTMPTMSQTRPRGFSQGLNYIAPTDGREHDPLQRWRGAPVIAWSVGGVIATSFPKDIPRYAIGQTVPSIIRSPGEFKIRNIREVDPLPERLTGFPGPLKGKSKKKDIVAWLTSGIQILESDASYLRSLAILSHEDKRIEERSLLWKILRVFVEHDGILEGNPSVDKAVRDVLSPDLEDVAPSAAPLYATGADLTGISQSASGTRSEPVDPSAVDQLRKHLLRGEREKAVWEAVDKRLWAHAMLISNTVSRDLYKQVAQEFIQKEVKSIGDNTESLAALYEVFAGNFEESIDELVPPSARAGFQMMSTSATTVPSKGALDGLDRWRETLGLILSNRSTDDSQALNALGKLLSGYGRAEAAHICFLFARSHTVFGGIDDPQTNVVLIGADHLRQPYQFDKEMEPILLSEVFEYGNSLAHPSASGTSSPHLAAYKLQHATILAEYGFRDKALLYCDAIAASVTAQTRRSPYHHAAFIEALDELSRRLKQSPKDGNTSWISKPSIDKVSGSFFAKFNKFVAGDGDDAASTGSGTGSGAENGPFARIAGGTPAISRSPSQSDIYGSYGNSNGSAIPTNGIPIPVAKSASRYAPGSSFSPLDQQGSYGSQPRNSFEGIPSGDHKRYEPQRQISDYRPSSQPYPPQQNSSYQSQPSHSPYGNPETQFAETHSPYARQISTPVTDHPTSNIYESPPSHGNFDGQQYSSGYNPSQVSSRQTSSNYDPVAPAGYASTSNSYGPPATSVHEGLAVDSDPSGSVGYEAPKSSSYEPLASSGYEPPASSGYEPPSYEPNSMNDEPESPIETRPKKKSFMDDDEDDIPSLKKESAPGEKTKAEKDREADEAFRKAAEADAAKSSQAPAKKGWGLGGWFGGGGKKEPDMNQPNKPIRAKLGEASSFYYDPELKRWMNKKGGDTAPTSSATPPPPKAGPPRTASGPPAPPGGPTSSPRPSSLAQRAVSDQVHSSPLAQSDGTTLTPFSGLAPPNMVRSASNGSAVSSSGPPSAPPSRPGTGMSNASSIDDLLGPAAPRKGGKATVKAKKKGRGYIDVMGDKPAAA